MKINLIIRFLLFRVFLFAASLTQHRRPFLRNTDIEYHFWHMYLSGSEWEIS